MDDLDSKKSNCSFEDKGLIKPFEVFQSYLFFSFKQNPVSEVYVEPILYPISPCY